MYYHPKVQSPRKSRGLEDWYCPGADNTIWHFSDMKYYILRSFYILLQQWRNTTVWYFYPFIISGFQIEFQKVISLRALDTKKYISDIFFPSYASREEKNNSLIYGEKYMAKSVYYALSSRDAKVDTACDKDFDMFYTFNHIFEQECIYELLSDPYCTWIVFR